jgi:hypothetical protein
MVSLPGSASIREQLGPPFRGPPVRRQLGWLRIEGDCGEGKGDESRCTGPSPSSVRQSGTCEIRSGMASVHGAASTGSALGQIVGRHLLWVVPHAWCGQRSSGSWPAAGVVRPRSCRRDAFLAGLPDGRSAVMTQQRNRTMIRVIPSQRHRSQRSCCSPRPPWAHLPLNCRMASLKGLAAEV